MKDAGKTSTEMPEILQGVGGDYCGMILNEGTKYNASP